MLEGRLGAVPAGDAGDSGTRVRALTTEIQPVDRRGELVGSLDDTAGPELVGLQQAVRVVAGVCAEGAAEVAVGENNAVGDRVREPGCERVEDAHAGVGVLLLPASVFVGVQAGREVWSENGCAVLTFGRQRRVDHAGYVQVAGRGVRKLPLTVLLPGVADVFRRRRVGDGGTPLPVVLHVGLQPFDPLRGLVDGQMRLDVAQV